MAVQPSEKSPPELPPVNRIDTWMLQAMKGTPISNGLAILIGCTNSSKHKEPLGGVVRDLVTLQRTFSETLLFTTLCLNNPTVEHVKAVVKCTSELGATAIMLPEKWRRIVVTFSGHGDEDYLYTRDGCMCLRDDIVKPLQAMKAKKLAMLPKLFFVDASGGLDTDVGVHVPNLSWFSESSPVSRGGGGRVSSTGNCFIAYSTRQAFEHSTVGGFWIQTLAKELTNLENIDKTIQDVMTAVNKTLINLCNKKKMAIQQPVTESTLTEDVKLLQEALDLMQLEACQQLGQQQQPQLQLQDANNPALAHAPERVSAAVLEMRRQHKKLYEKAIKGKVTVGIRVVRFNNIGLPRSGKTSFRRRLMGEIKNILLAMSRSGKVEPSTGVAESAIQIIRTMCLEMGAILSAEEWTVIKDFREEIIMLNQLIHQITTAAPISSDASSEAGSILHDSSGTSVKVPGIETPISESKPSAIKAQSAPQPLHMLDQNVSEDENIQEVFSFMNKAMEESDWIKVKCLLEDLILIINTDTGGQAEFLDLHASLVSGPSFNLLFSRLVDSLDKMFKIYYTNEEGISTEEEDSTMTVEEVMYQALASVACFGDSFLDEDQSSAQGKFLSKSKVMFVGTHRDLVSDEEFKEKDDFLKKRIKDTEFYKRDMIEFDSKDQVMVAVNNFSGGQDEIKRIRRRLEQAITENVKKIEIPVAWLILSFYLRNTKMRIMSLETCEGIAMKLNIGPEELQEALWFLHHCVGLLLYYPELEALKDTVICDIQVVFDSASNLIKNTFTFNKVGPRISENFSEKALFSQSDLEKAALKQTDNLLPLQNVVALLKHLSILTPSEPSDSMREPTYFMPCVLKSARAEDLSVDRRDSDPAPLMLRYQCGYMPVGVFPAMITNLVSKQGNIGWEMVEEGLRKNRVQFIVGKDFDTVTLISHPRFFEVILVRSDGCRKSTDSLCYELLHVIETALSSVTSRMNYNFSMGYQFGFECPAHPTREHLCILADETAWRMKCLLDPKNPKLTYPLEARHSVWFTVRNAAKGTSNFSAYVSSLPALAHPYLDQQLDCDDIIHIAHHMLHWEENLCSELGLTEVDVHDIPIIKSTPELQRREALRRWMNCQGLQATYGNLLQLFVRVGHSSCAKALCEVLRKKCADAERC